MSNDGGLRLFDGAVAIVTGGASGIGRAMCSELVRRGAEVVVADVRGELAQRVAAEIRQTGGNATAAAVDVREYPAVEDLVRTTADRQGRVDFMFNNAGISIVGQVGLYDLETWRRVLAVNLDGVIHGVQAAYPIMRRQGFGHIVNTSSIAGLLPFAMSAVYTASKYAVVGLSLALRGEAACWGVRVSVLCPGPIRTPMIANDEMSPMLHPFPADVDPRRFLARWAIDPAKLVEKALRAIAKNQPLIVIPRWHRLVWCAYYLGLPFALRREQKQAEKIKEFLASQAVSRDVSQASG